MSGVSVEVTVGRGGWTTTRVVSLIACPHVGDYIDVLDQTIACDTVIISGQKVYVRSKRDFISEQQAKDFFPE